jgi:selenide, water dikinase
LVTAHLRLPGSDPVTARHRAGTRPVTESLERRRRKPCRACQPLIVTSFPPDILWESRHHQVCHDRSDRYIACMTAARLTQFARGGGCACKIPPGELEDAVARLIPDDPGADLLIGVEHGDDAAVVQIGPDRAIVATADFFTPVIDDAYTFGRIAAANALSDVYAVGGEPLVALNLLGWPRDKLPAELAAEVLRGGLVVARSAGCHVAGGHSIDDPEPKYGMAVTGLADPGALLRIDAGAAGLPLSLSKPIGIGVLNAWHKSTGAVSQDAVDVMTTLNAAASRAALAAGARCATDVTGFGLLGHLFKLARASRVTAVIDHAAVPVLPGARAALQAGYIPGGSRRNLDWVRPHLDSGGLAEDELLLLADAQTSGGLLVAGELPGATVIGELRPAGGAILTIRLPPTADLGITAAWAGFNRRYGRALGHNSYPVCLTASTRDAFRGHLPTCHLLHGRMAMVQAARGPADRAEAPGARLDRRALVLAAALFGLAIAGYAADVATHPLRLTLTWFDLNIYNNAGLITRHAQDTLYSWQFLPGVKYLYTPFAALCFAAGSLLPWAVLKWLMTVVSIAAMAATVWLAIGQLGWAGRDRATLALGVSAVALWTEPVLRSIHVGQIELLLMALIAWDLCQPDGRRWKGLGIGLAAGIKLVPLIFIPYLVLAGKLRQAGVALAVFAGTAALGFAVLPYDSVKWWLTGYFLHAGDFSSLGLGSLLNQSLLALITRTPAGAGSVTALWLGVAGLVAVTGLLAAALLTRVGRPTAGWVTCGLTGVLISPISWDNHWVWIVPLLAVGVDAAVRAKGAARWAYWTLAAAMVAVFADWPAHWTGPRAFVPQGLVGFDTGRHSKSEIFRLHGLELIGWNLFVLAGLVIFGVLLVAATRAWRDRPPPGEHDFQFHDHRYPVGRGHR